MTSAIAFTLLSLRFSGLNDVAFGCGNRRRPAGLLITAGSWVIGGALYARVREVRFQVTGKKAACALVSGVLVFLIVNFLIAAVARGEASVVIPIANLSFVAALLISVTLGMERLSVRKLIAVGGAIVSIWLLSLK